jgi:hypothetical protein
MSLKNDADPLFKGKEMNASGEIRAITLDSNVVIYVGENREHQFRIENEFSIENTVTGLRFVVKYDPYNRSNRVQQNLTELASIIGTQVLESRVSVDGLLELHLSGDMLLIVEPENHFEAWTYTFKNYILACPPGGFKAQS